MHGNQHALDCLCASLNLSAAGRRYWASFRDLAAWNETQDYAWRVELRRLELASAKLRQLTENGSGK